MDIAKSNIVKAIAGRDKGKLFFVLAIEGEYLFLADGKTRKVENPKRKKHKHVQFVMENDQRAGKKIRSDEKITNSELRRTLAAICEDGNLNQEE